MGSVFGRIQNYLPSLTPNEIRVTEYLSSHPEKAIENSIHEVAKAIGVSASSVSRLANTLGYRDWKELRLSLAKDSTAPANPVFSDIAEDDSDQEVVEKIFNTNIRSLQDTLKQMDFDSIKKIVAAIIKTDRIVFFGSGGSGYTARDEAIRFAHLELSAEAYTETFQMMLQAARMKKGQVAFGFSNSGRSAATVNVLAEARKNKALTVGISNYRNTPLEEASDIMFCTSRPITGEMTAAPTARIAVMSVMDAIYALAVRHGKIAVNVGYLNTVLESTIRIPVGKHISSPPE